LIEKEFFRRGDEGMMVRLRCTICRSILWLDSQEIELENEFEEFHRACERQNKKKEGDSS